MEKAANKGNSGQITRDYLNSLLVEAGHIDTTLADTSMTLFGKKFQTPIMTGALSHLENTYPDGMKEMAKGAKNAGAVMWCGMGSEKELEDMLSTGADVIKIIKTYQDNSIIFKKIKHAEEHGAFAVGMDIDHSFNRKGGYDSFDGLSFGPKTMEEIKAFVQSTKLPFILKGVLGLSDVKKCVEIGVSGIVLSHHNGRVDYAVPPLMLLPEAKKIVSDKFPIFVDCSIQSGMDVFKSLSLGAAACSIGRPLMSRLKKNGSLGVTDGIKELTLELQYAMEMSGIPDLNSMNPAIIHHRTF